MAAEASAVARLRVAQATYLPKTAADIEAELEGDEAAASLSVEEVEKLLREWIDRGVVEELMPADPGTDSPARYLIAQVFRHDIERRIVANLSQPRTVYSLQAILRSDPNVGQLTTASLEAQLADLAKRGLVKSIGSHADSGALVSAAQSDDDVIDMHRDKARALRERLEVPERAWQLEGEQWCMTKHAAEVLAVT